MFGLRTPIKKPTNSRVGNPPEEVQPTQTSNVRRSIGEWETAKAGPKPMSPTTSRLTVSAAPVKLSPKSTPPHDYNHVAAETTVATGSPPKQRYLSRTTEAKACLTKAMLHLGNSRNLKTEIKNGVMSAINRLFELVKEAESNKVSEKETIKEQDKEKVSEKTRKEGTEGSEIKKALKENSELLRENSQKMLTLNVALAKYHENLETTTYAGITSSLPRTQSPAHTTLHSVVVTSKDEMDTGEQVLEKIREVMNAKEGWIKVEKLRKAKDRKIIVGCRTKEEREMVKERLNKGNKQLCVEEVRNKDPLVILRDVLSYNTDEDVLTALRNQNGHLFKDLNEQEVRVAMGYRTKTRNPHACHIVLRVSPKIWLRALEAGALYIDLQRVKVADQSPLVQCSLCLGYGHSRRYCSEGQEQCSHCGGPHMRTKCELWRDGVGPSCCNCVKAKLDQTDHSAFSRDCAVRKRWDALARATTAYSC